MKSLDKKINNIRNSSYKPSDFIIADAKDADMGGGRRAPGYIREDDGKLTEKAASFKSYLTKMEEMTSSEMVDVMLMSMSSAERLVNKKIFERARELCYRPLYNEFKKFQSKIKRVLREKI